MCIATVKGHITLPKLKQGRFGYFLFFQYPNVLLTVSVYLNTLNAHIYVEYRVVSRSKNRHTPL